MGPSGTDEAVRETRTERKKRRKSYYVRNPDEMGSPFLFPPPDSKIEVIHPNGEKIYPIDDSWEYFQPKSPEGEFLDYRSTSQKKFKWVIMRILLQL